MTALLGTVLERDGSVYRVATEGGEIRAVLAGKAKRDTSRVVVGDRVRLEPDPEAELHAIVGVEPRTALLERRVPEGRGARPVAANVDQVFVVTASIDPSPIPQLIDRLLVVAEAKLRLDRKEDAFKEAKSGGYAIVAGDVELFIAQVARDKSEKTKSGEGETSSKP